MEEYLTFEYAPSWGSLTLQKARRFTEEEKKRYAEWYREVGFVGINRDSIRLEKLNLDDAEDVIGDRRCDGSFIGSNDLVWIITQDEWDALISLNQKKLEEQEEKNRQKEILRYRRVIFHCECQRVLYTEEESLALEKAFNRKHNEGGSGYVPHYYTVNEYNQAKERLAELGFVEEEKSDEPANELVLSAGDQYGNSCTVKFTETGWEVVDKAEEMTSGYLHADFDSPKNVTPGVCESLIRYFYHHEEGLPGLGGTPQQKYLYNYSIEERERIGNDGKPGYYA